MPTRLMLILPTLVNIGLASVAGALDPAGADRRLLAAVGIASVALVVAQLAVDERVVLAALRALRAMLGADAPAATPTVYGREWRELQHRIAALRHEAQQQRTTAQQAQDGSRRVEEALQASEQRYVLAVRGAQDGVWEHDLHNDSVWVSP